MTYPNQYPNLSHPSSPLSFSLLSKPSPPSSGAEPLSRRRHPSSLYFVRLLCWVSLFDQRRSRRQPPPRPPPLPNYAASVVVCVFASRTKKKSGEDLCESKRLFVSLFFLCSNFYFLFLFFAVRICTCELCLCRWTHVTVSVIIIF